MKLIEEEKLSLDTRLDTFFPNIANADIITISQMLRHRSGIFSFTDDSNYMSIINVSRSNEELALQIEGYESVFPPGSTSRYSNSNFMLLGFIAEKIEHKSLGEIFKERIYEPLKMTDSHFGIVPFTDHVALSYHKYPEWVKATNTNMTIPAGAGAITSTASNVNLFYTALFQGKFVSMGSLDEMKTLKDGFGMGMFPVNFDDKKGFAHDGGIDGFQSSAVYFPEDSLSLVYLSNGVAPIARIDMIVGGVIKLYYGKEYNFPTFEPPKKISPEILDQYIGVYSNDDFPLNTTITHADGILYARATGQNPFVLTQTKEHHFQYMASMIFMDFSPEKSTIHFRQGDNDFIFSKLIFEEKNLDQFTGYYGLVGYPGESATVKVIGDRLLISATWQGESTDYEFLSYAKNKFSGLQSELEFLFNDGEWSIDWSEGGGSYEYKRKN